MTVRQKTTDIVVHCSATKPGQDIGAGEIRDWHRAKGWSDIGYHAVIRIGGRIEWGRHFDVAGAHVKGHNSTSVGICLVGGLDADGNPADNFDHAQKHSLRMLIAVMSCAYPLVNVCGHRDMSPDLDGDGVIQPDEWLKECPCFDVAKFLIQR